MSFLYFLEGLRNSVLDALFSVITLCGEETVFMAVGMIIFWCVSKYQGYYLLCAGFLGTAVNQFLKMLFRVPRPWVKDPNFTIVETAKEAASGYSFPSGHTQTSVGLFGGVARWNKGKILRCIMIALCVLVPLSRMYLGVHTPADVCVSVGVALVFIFGLYPLFKKAEKSPITMYAILTGITLAVILFMCFVSLYPFPADVYTEANIHNLNSAVKNAYTLLGCMLGLIAVYTLDIKFVHFETKAAWWAQIIKVIIGIGLVLAVKEGMRTPLEALFGNEYVARAFRYFIMVIVGGGLWPMTFRFFAKTEKNKEA